MSFTLCDLLFFSRPLLGQKILRVHPKWMGQHLGCRIGALDVCVNRQKCLMQHAIRLCSIRQGCVCRRTRGAWQTELDRDIG